MQVVHELQSQFQGVRVQVGELVVEQRGHSVAEHVRVFFEVIEVLVQNVFIRRVDLSQREVGEHPLEVRFAQRLERVRIGPEQAALGAGLEQLALGIALEHEPDDIAQVLDVIAEIGVDEVGAELRRDAVDVQNVVDVSLQRVQLRFEHFDDFFRKALAIQENDVAQQRVEEPLGRRQLALHREIDRQVGQQPQVRVDKLADLVQKGRVGVFPKSRDEVVQILLFWELGLDQVPPERQLIPDVRVGQVHLVEERVEPVEALIHDLDHVFELDEREHFRSLQWGFGPQREPATGLVELDLVEVVDKALQIDEILESESVEAELVENVVEVDRNLQLLVQCQVRRDGAAHDGAILEDVFLALELVQTDRVERRLEVRVAPDARLDLVGDVGDDQVGLQSVALRGVSRRGRLGVGHVGWQNPSAADTHQTTSVEFGPEVWHRGQPQPQHLVHVGEFGAGPVGRTCGLCVLSEARVRGRLRALIVRNKIVQRPHHFDSLAVDFLGVCELVLEQLGVLVDIFLLKEHFPERLGLHEPDALENIG